MRRLTLLSGPLRPLPSFARRWIVAQRSYVAVEVLDPASAAAARRYPHLARAAGDDLVAVSDAGAVWSGPAAWVTALWALRAGRADALRLARPDRRDRARDVLLEAAAAGASPFGAPRPTPFEGLCVGLWVVSALGLLVPFPGGAAIVATVGLVLGAFGGTRGLARATLVLFAWGAALYGSYALDHGVAEAIGKAFPAALVVALAVAILSRSRPAAPFGRAPRGAGPAPAAGAGTARV